MTAFLPEILAAPATVYVAAVGSSFPKVDTDPADPWVMVGTAGDLNYDDTGVSVTIDQTLGTFTPSGSTGVRKVWRSAEGLIVDLNLVDLSPLQFAQALNNASVTTTAAGASQPGQKSFPVLQGQTVALFALLVRGLSTVDDTQFASQFQVPVVYNAGKPKLVFGKKATPAMLAVSFVALADDTDGFGLFVDQTAVATS